MRKEFLHRELAAVRKIAQRSESSLEVTVKGTKELGQSETDSMDRYFSDPLFPILHTALMIPAFQENTEKLRELFGLSSANLNSKLETLGALGIIHKNRKGYTANEIHWHLPEDSHLQVHFQTSLRLRALERIQRGNQNTDYSFGAIFTADEQTRIRLRQKILDLIKDVQKDVAKASSKKLIQINIDLLDLL
jgi:hypothetical protein